MKLWNGSLPQYKRRHHHCEKHILAWSIFLVFINSTLSPTNTICHSPEDLKCRLKLHIGIKSIKQHTRYHSLDQKTLCCPTDKSTLQTQLRRLLPQVFSLQSCRCFSFFSLGSWSPAGFPMGFLPHGLGNHRAIPPCSTRGCKTLGSYWLFRNVFLLLVIFMYNIWRDTICVFDLDISLASYLNNNLKNILQRKRTLFIWMSFIIILLYFIPYY